MKQQFMLSLSGEFQAYVYESNRRIIPSSAKLTVYNPGTATELVMEALMTIGTDGLLSYTLTPADNATTGANYKAVVTYDYNGATYSVTLFYDVVRSLLFQVISDSDIAAELPQLTENGWRVHGTAESGTFMTVVDSELARYEDDYFTGGTAYLVSKDETREITGFLSSSGTVTTKSFSGAVSTDAYILTRSFTREIERAFEKMEAMLVSAGKRPELILDPYDLRELHIYLAVAEAVKGLVLDGESFWWTVWKEYEKKAGAAFSMLNLKYDHSEDGFISGGEESVRLSSGKAGRR